MDSWSRKAVGALKDVASMGLANMNSRIAEIDIAVVKTTLHNDFLPKEKHVLTAVAATKERGLRRYLKRVVEERLMRTKNWMVAVKTLALIHRLMRDGFPLMFTEEGQEMRHSSDITPLEGVSQSFEDCSTPLALQFTRWVQKYSCYLAQRLHCNRLLNHSISAENQNRKLKTLEISQLLEHLRSLQLVLDCLLDCTPREGPVAVNPLIHYALNLIVKDCPQIYAAINPLICKLLGSFFDMPSDKALSLVDIYKRILQQYDKLSDFYGACTRMGLTHGHGDYPSHKKFLVEMEDHITKYRHRLSDMEDMRRRYNSHPLEEEHVTNKETALKNVIQQDVVIKKVIQQDAVVEERPPMTWWDVQDAVPVLPRDRVTFRSTATDQEEANYDRYHAVNEWEKALEMSIVGSSSNTNYQSGDRMGRSVLSSNDGKQIDLAFLNENRENPFQTLEMPSSSDLLPGIEAAVAHNDQQHQEAAADDQRQYTASLQNYIPTQNTEKAGVVPESGQPVWKFNPFE